VRAGTALHATCLVIGEAGLLLRGPSGAGKSTLARRLISAATRDGRYASLVGDDRIRLEAVAGRLVARPHPAIAGRLEVRGVGLTQVVHEPGAVVRLVVDCGMAPLERLPPDTELWAEMEGVRVHRTVAHWAEEDRVLLVLDGVVGRSVMEPFRP
jgi:signal recognition particle GTPase